MKFLKLSPRGFANEYTIFATTNARAEEIKKSYDSVQKEDGYVEEITERRYRSHCCSGSFAVYLYELEDVTGGYSFFTARTWKELIKELGE